MKHPLTHRAVALLLALILAMPLAAPAWAADPDLTIEIEAGKSGPLIKGEKVTLTAKWNDGASADGVTYTWDCEDPAVTLSSYGTTSDPTVEVTAVESGTAKITVEATRNGEKSTAEYDLTVTELTGIRINGEKAGTSGELVLGQTPALSAEWSNGTPEEAAYEWTVSGSGAVTLPAGGTGNNTVTATAGKEGSATVTLTVTRGSEGKDTTSLALKVIPLKLEGIQITGADGKPLDDNTLMVGAAATLEVKWLNDTKPAGVAYTWSSSDNGEFINIPSSGGGSRTVTAKAKGTATITVTAKWSEGSAQKTATATCTLTVMDNAAESITLNQTTLALPVNDTAQLTATVKPDRVAGTVTIEWSSSDPDVATVTKSDDGKTATITALKVGRTVITAKSGDAEATCEVSVVSEALGITIVNGGTIIWTSSTDDRDKVLSAHLTGLPEGVTPTVIWTAVAETGLAGVVEPTFTAMNAQGSSVTVNEQTAGRFVITAKFTYGGQTYESNTLSLTISGIVLSGGAALNPKEKTLKMVENGSAALSYTAYGAADDNSTRVEWTSSDASVVSVMPDAGNLNAWKAGTAIIIATKGSYSAYCTVTVEEDTSAVADKYPNTSNGKLFTATTSEPLTMDVVYPRLREICLEKTSAMTGGIELPLQYITNLSVPTSQGTLYYNYNTESDTGTGVGVNDQFAWTANGSVHSVSKLYFVPKPGVSGTVDITFTAVAEGNRNFTGVIRVSVGTGSGSSTSQISYRAQAGEPVWFASSDFDAYCQSVNGRSYNYIIFNLPKASEGVLYYNYAANSGIPVTTTTRFTPSGRYTLDDVCFVPNAAFQGKSVTITFRGADTSGTAISGEVEVTVVQPSTVDDPANVAISGERGKPVVFQNNLFNDACQRTLGDTLYFVTFTLPDPNQGTLYINYRGEGDYGSRVTAGTHCYYSGVPGLGSVSFVPATSAAGRVAISYTGYSVGGASFSGTLYISLEEVDRSTIHYAVVKGGTVTFRASDFNNAGQYTAGSSVSYVIFRTISPSSSLGVMWYRRTSSSSTRITPSLYGTSSSYRYYVSPTSSQNGLNSIYFEATDAEGTVTITYDAYSSSGQLLVTEGKLEIKVGSIPPEDINLSCRTGGQAGLPSSTLSNVCGAVMKESLSYIEITSVPDSKQGHLYYDYNGFGTGETVTEGRRFYCVGSPNISQLAFVPFARFTGQAEITYIGYSSDGQEQVSGRILVNVSRTTNSSYFTDMNGLSWAVDSVDYLYRNGAVQGIGYNLFAPVEIVRRCDFVLMLVRAYELTATGSASFSDVPTDYYTDAIRVAAVLGIISGDENGRFYPTDPLTRQDAVVMLYKTLQVCGKATTNGLAADLSGYHDEEEIAPDAKEAMGNLVQMGVVEGDGGYLQPKRQLVRAEAAIFLHTIMTL